MVVQVIDGGRSSLDAILFGNTTRHNDMEFVNNIVGEVKLAGVTNYFSNSIGTLNNIYNSDEAIMYNKSIVLQHGAMKNEDVYTIITRDNISRCNSRMQEVIMSHPEMMRLNTLGAVTGYNNVVANTSLQSYVNSGVVKFNDDIMEYTSFYSSEEEPDEVEMIAVKETWKTISEMLADGLDPTER